jgi:hypothetical protein
VIAKVTSPFAAFLAKVRAAHKPKRNFMKLLEQASF